MLNEIDISFINKLDPKVEKIIEIDGVKYGSIKDMKNLSLGEYVDIDHYIQKPIDNLHKVCAILCRPVLKEEGDLYIIEDYNPETMEERANIFMEKMNVSQLFGLANLFQVGVSSYIEHLNLSSHNQKKVKKEKK